MPEKRFIDNLNFINNDLLIGSENKNFEFQREMLNSESNNITFELIEKKLNTLYEKTRALEDIVAYSKSFLEQEVHIYKDRVKSRLKAIEDARDSLKNPGFISHIVPFTNNKPEALKDRDGSNLSPCDISNGKLIISGQEVKSPIIKEVSKKNELIPHNDTLNQIIQGVAYRTFYLLDGPATNGVKEEIIVSFKEDMELNFVKIVPSNCEIVQIILVNQFGMEEKLTDIENEYCSLRKIKGAKFIIISKNYQKKAYEIDSNRMHSSFWNRIKEKEYSTLMGNQITFDMERESGLQKYREDYIKYEKDLIKWAEDKKLIERANKLQDEKYQKEFIEYKEAGGV